MGLPNNGLMADRAIPVDAAWDALCAQLEAIASGVAAKFARTEQAHLSFSEVHDLAQLVDLADDGLALDPRLVEFATQCLAEVADRAVRTGFRPKYFDDYRCLDALWEVSARRRQGTPPTTQPQVSAL